MYLRYHDKAIYSGHFYLLSDTKINILSVIRKLRDIIELVLDKIGCVGKTFIILARNLLLSANERNSFRSR